MTYLECRSRASLSALETVAPVHNRMRRILSVTDVSSLDGDHRHHHDKHHDIYHQMRQVCSSKEDLTDSLQRQFFRKNNGRILEPSVGRRQRKSQQSVAKTVADRATNGRANNVNADHGVEIFVDDVPVQSQRVRVS